MTLSTHERSLLAQREQLTQSERLIVDHALDDLAYRGKLEGIALAGDDHLASLEAAFVRYMLASRGVDALKPEDPV